LFLEILDKVANQITDLAEGSGVGFVWPTRELGFFVWVGADFQQSQSI